MKNLHQLSPLSQWAELQNIRRTVPAPLAIRRIAKRGRISELHALAFCQANKIGGGTVR